MESFRVESQSAWIWKGIRIWHNEIALERKDHWKALGLKVTPHGKASGYGKVSGYGKASGYGKMK